MMSRSYFRHPALQLNFMTTPVIERRERLWVFGFSTGRFILWLA
jgi:hypothetical protein